MDTCAIWGTEATEIPAGGRDGRMLDSPRAGGKYFITGSAEAGVERLDDNAKARLTSWLVDQRNLGERCPEIETNTINNVRQRPIFSVQQKINRLLQIMYDEYPNIGERIHIFDKATANRYQIDAIDYEEYIMIDEYYMAHSESSNATEFHYLLRMMIDQELLEYNNVYYIITFNGHNHLYDLAKTSVDYSQAFVAMWFDESMNEAYENGIASGVRDAGYEPVRIDRKDFNGKIDDEIIAEIRRSRFVVADFTQGESGARGGVYYEAGFAHGLDIPVFFTCREDAIGEVHFDTNHYNHIVWSDPADLRTRLSKRISAVIGDGPNKPRP